MDLVTKGMCSLLPNTGKSRKESLRFTILHTMKAER